MKKLLIASAALAVSTSFAFAASSSSSGPTFPTINLTNTLTQGGTLTDSTKAHVDQSVFNVQTADVKGHLKANVTGLNTANVTASGNKLNQAGVDQTLVNIQTIDVLGFGHH